MVWKISEEELKNQAPVVQERLKDKEAGVKKYRPAQDVDRYQAPPKSRWEQVREGILKGGERAGEVGKKGVGKFKEFAKNHPVNNPKGERKERREPREKQKEPRGRVSQRDIYKDGVLVEKVHYGPTKQPKQPKPPRRRREDPLGGFGAGMSFRDMMPGSNQGFGLGGMSPFSDPMHRSEPKRQKKKGRRQPREEPFDYIEHMNKLPDSWKGLGF